MKNPKITFIMVYAFLSVCSLAHARHPAVDPVRGLSIDEYPQISPEDAQGFEFSQTPDRTTASEGAIPDTQNSQLVTTNIPSVTQAELEGHTPNLPTLFLLIILLGMPFGLWWFIHKKIQEDGLKSYPENTIDITRARKEKEDKDDFPKAS